MAICIAACRTEPTAELNRATAILARAEFMFGDHEVQESLLIRDRRSVERLCRALRNARVVKERRGLPPLDLVTLTLL